jgi:hypothetical protein
MFGEFFDGIHACEVNIKSWTAAPDMLKTAHNELINLIQQLCIGHCSSSVVIGQILSM